MAELAKLDVIIGGDVKPLVAALNEGKTAIEGFETVGADAFLNLNVGLSKTAQAALVAGNDIKSLTAALDVLQAEQTGIVKGTTLWNLYETQIRKVNAQLDVLEAQLPVVEAETKAVGSAGSGGFSAMGKSIGGVLTPIRQLAYILPGIGLAGLFNLAFEAISAAADELGIFNSEAKQLAEANKKAIESFSDEANKVTILVARLRDENATRQDKINIIKQLQDAAPAYFSNLKLEGDEVINLTADYANFGRAILLVAKIKAASDLNQKNVTAGIEEQLHTSERLLLLEQKKAYAEKGGVDVAAQRLAILEDQLEAQNKIAQESKPLLNIIIEAEKELAALGGDPTQSPITKTITTPLKEAKKAIEEIKHPLEEITVVLSSLNGVNRELSKGPQLQFENIDEFIKKLQDAQSLKKFNQQLETSKQIASELADIFSQLFVDIVTTGKISFQQLSREVAQFIGRLVQAVLEALLLKAILSVITGGAGAAFNPASLAGINFLIPHAEGGIFAQPTVIGGHVFGEKGAEALIPLTQLSNMISGLGNSNITINGELRASGTDLVVALNRGNVRIGRNYGSNFGN